MVSMVMKYPALKVQSQVCQDMVWYSMVWNAWYGMAMKYLHSEFSLKYAKVTKNIIAIALPTGIVCPSFS